MDNEYMQQLIADFSKHLTEAMEKGSKANFKSSNNSISNVLVCGLGGSGIGGTNVQKVIEDQLSVPFNTNKGYHLPQYIDENSLVICCSYSGNTEETLFMYEQAKDRGSEVAIVCSGGKFQEIAEENGHNHIIIPGGLPPRAAFGLAFPQLFYVLNQYKLIDNSFEDDFQKAIDLIDADEENIRKEGKEISDFLINKIPVLYSETRWEGVLVRFRQQIAENSKMLSWHHVIPEMNHNEIVGWKEEYDELAVLIYKADDDYYRNKSRIGYLKKVISNSTSRIKEVDSKGKSFIEKAIYWIHLNDWASFYLADSRNMDSVEVDVISGLKDMLADLD